MRLSLIGLTVSALAFATWQKESPTLSHLPIRDAEKLRNYLDGWHNTEVHNGPSFMYKASSQGASFGKEEARQKVMAVVTARDLYIGCHSYQQYVSPHFETVFAFEQNYAKLFELEKLVTSMDRNQTMGAHLFITDDHIGENSARSLGLGLIDNIMEIQPHFMFSVNCDMHPIPTNHKNYQSFEYITEELARTMAQERDVREYKNTSSWTQRDELSADDKPIYAMNTLIWLEFNSTEDLFTSEWHGMDHFGWYRDSFMNSKGKPDVLASTGSSWTTEVDIFVESHALCFDVQKMQQIRDEYFIWDSIPSETHAIGPLANKHGWVVRRHNELHMFFDQARSYDEIMNNEFKYGPISGSKDKIDQMLFMNFELASKRRNPVEGYNIYQQYIKKNGVHMPDYYGGGFISFIWRDHYVPSFIHNSKATSEEGKRWVYSSMRMAGYLPTAENNTFESPGAYPSTLQITVHDEKQTDKNSFLTFTNGEKVTDYVSYDPILFHVGKDYPAERRTFTLPIDDNTILDSTNGAIGRRDTYGWEYFHVVADECERDVTYDNNAKPSFIQRRVIDHESCIGCD